VDGIAQKHVATVQQYQKQGATWSSVAPAQVEVGQRLASERAKSERNPPATVRETARGSVLTVLCRVVSDYAPLSHKALRFNCLSKRSRGRFTLHWTQRQGSISDSHLQLPNYPLITHQEGTITHFWGPRCSHVRFSPTSAGNRLPPVANRRSPIRATRIVICQLSQPTPVCS
jgi:hypothetical protein